MSLNIRTGGRETDSFVTVAEADVLIEQLPDDSTEWQALSTAQKEYRLILAAQLVGYLPLRGYKIYRGQALAFPRSGGLYPPRLIPPEVKETQVFIAYAVIHRALSNRPDVTESQGSAVHQISLGGLLFVGFGVGKSGATGNLMDQIMSSLSAPVYIRMKRYLAQMRGWQADEAVYTLSSTTTATTTSSSSSTTSSSSSTTTSTAP